MPWRGYEFLLVLKIKPRFPLIPFHYSFKIAFYVLFVPFRKNKINHRVLNNDVRSGRWILVREWAQIWLAEICYRSTLKSHYSLYQVLYSSQHKMKFHAAC